MPVMRLTIAALLLSSLILVAAGDAAADYVFTNGTLLTMTEDGAVDADLRLVDQRITAIGRSLSPGKNDVVVDMQGGFLMPGLAEMHAHVPAPEQGERYRDDVLFLWVANGITTARGMLGHPDHLELRRALQAHEVLGPRLITSGPSFNGNSVSSPTQARQMVREQVAAGYDFLKIHPGVSRPQFDALADEARRLGIRFAGHVPAEVGLRHALEQGQATVDHLDGFLRALVSEEDSGAEGGLFGVGLAGDANLDRLPELVEWMQAAGSWVVPTETLIENFAGDDVEALLDRPENVYLPGELRERYREALAGAGSGTTAAARALSLRKQIISALHDAGVGVLLGSDSPQIFNVPGFSIHRELEAMVAAGLTPAEALATGTVAPARYFGRAEDFGQLRVGLSADLVLLSEDPTADIANSRAIEGVMVRGRWLDRAELDAGLEDIRARYGR
jgi:imidazolonepropionase-like amidohydrolase